MIRDFPCVVQHKNVIRRQNRGGIVLPMSTRKMNPAPDFTLAMHGGPTAYLFRRRFRIASITASGGSFSATRLAILSLCPSSPPASKV
jgi:hypothetical protein